MSTGVDRAGAIEYITVSRESTATEDPTDEKSTADFFGRGGGDRRERGESG